MGCKAEKAFNPKNYIFLVEKVVYNYSAVSEKWEQIANEQSLFDSALMRGFWKNRAIITKGSVAEKGVQHNFGCCEEFEAGNLPQIWGSCIGLTFTQSL